MLYIPFNSIEVFLRQWKGDNERLWAIKHSTDVSCIAPPCNSNPGHCPKLGVLTIWLPRCFKPVLTLKVPSKICSRRHSKNVFYFSEKTSLDISCELSAKQMIHMKCQDLFSLKNNKKKNKKKLLSAVVVTGALRVKPETFSTAISAIV